MADERQVEQWLSRISYKPGWKFECFRDQMSGFFPNVLIEVSTADADGQLSGPIRVASRHEVPEWIQNRHDFLRWLYDRIVERERHEALEWLRYGGERVYEPHPGGTSTFNPTPNRLVGP